ncbi:GAF and ANTAR domain-containing protein [Actinospongicola halichondriae]|uniref:GAF and ANTAR domain-containing protein n=1 Tax=Actinospongicola halichondriae TaxID=3236844 RepID=UPI003D529B7E
MDDPRRIASVFVELADTLVTDFDVVDFMTLLADRCVELLHADQAGVLLADSDGRLHSVASSDDSAQLLDLFELQNQEGPCFDCFHSGEAVINQAMDDPAGPWPLFAAEATRLGFSVAHAIPMRLRGDVIGAVNVFSAGSDQIPAEDAALGQALADVATIGLLQERTIREALRLSEQLQAALTSRVVIEQAKGMLAERLDVSMDVAFGLLRGYARNENLRLSLVAEAILEGDISADRLDPGGTDPTAR